MFSLFTVRSQVGVQDIKICIIADVHYFDTSLLINDGPAFQEYLSHDRKLLQESYAITESLIDSLIAEQPDIVLVTGDITKDGEMVCHQKMADYFGELEADGAQVFVCPGNHDINNPHAVAFDYDTTYQVASVTPGEFKNVYANHGYSDAIAVDTASLSYVAEPIQGLQILSMDVCRYDSNYIDNYPLTDGGFEPQVLQWAKDRIIDANSQGKIILALEHHNLMEHFTNQKMVFTEYVIDDWENISTELADLGLKVVFTGHFHAHDIVSNTSPAGNTIYDVETGSTVTWPCPYRVMTLHTDTTLEISGKKVENIDYNTGSMTFQEYAHHDLEVGIPPTIIYYLTQPPYSLGQSIAEFMEPAFTESIIAHYNGNEGSPSFGTEFIIFTLYLSGYGYIAEGLESIWDDKPPDDWNINADMNSTADELVLDLTVFLEGPFNGTSMDTYLNPSFIPLAQPYLSLPWMYTGLDSTGNIPSLQIVDWVLVELRDAADASSANETTTVGRQAAWLLNDGSVVALDGSSPLKFYHNQDQQLYAVVRHRNHLDILSANPLIESGGTYSYDFTTGGDLAYGGDLAQKEVETNVWAMIAGDANPDGEIDMEDKTGFWSIFAGKTGYHPGDFDLNTNINNQDKNEAWRINLGKTSQVPDSE